MRDWTPEDVISAMASFARDGFDEAAAKHWRGEYSKDPQQQRAGYERWRAMRDQLDWLISANYEALSGSRVP